MRRQSDLNLLDMLRPNAVRLGRCGSRRPDCTAEEACPEGGLVSSVAVAPKLGRPLPDGRCRPSGTICEDRAIGGQTAGFLGASRRLRVERIEHDQLRLPSSAPVRKGAPPIRGGRGRGMKNSMIQGDPVR